MDKIGYCLQYSPLIELDVTDCELGSFGMSAIGAFLNKTRVVTLHAAKNKAGDYAVTLIANSLGDKTCKI